MYIDRNFNLINDSKIIDIQYLLIGCFYLIKIWNKFDLLLKIEELKNIKKN